jgi:hypothetical protein
VPGTQLEVNKWMMLIMLFMISTVMLRVLAQQL